MDLGQFVVNAGDYVFGRGVRATANASMTGVEQQKRRVVNKRVQRALMIVMGITTLAFMARTIKHTDVPSGLARAAVAATQAPATGSRPGHIDYAPGADLEAEELAVLGKSRRSIDVAMYAFTDTQIAGLLANKARQGVKVRVYRDADQYSQEESRANGRATTSAILEAAGVEVRVKTGRELMHLKSYVVDGSFIRTGSANWSRAGLEDQDNDVFYIQSPETVKDFSAEFEDVWNRSDNVVLSASRESR